MDPLTKLCCVDDDVRKGTREKMSVIVLVFAPICFLVAEILINIVAGRIKMQNRKGTKNASFKAHIFEILSTNF